MRFKGLDLNLLVVLDALLTERTLTAAASSINLSQPAMIPPMVSGTARIATMPLRLVQHFKTTFPLRIIELPLPLPAFTEAVLWPALHNSDPASIWMREILLQEASRMTSPQDPKRGRRHS